MCSQQNSIQQILVPDTIISPSQQNHSIRFDMRHMSTNYECQVALKQHHTVVLQAGRFDFRIQCGNGTANRPNNLSDWEICPQHRYHQIRFIFLDLLLSWGVTPCKIGMVLTFLHASSEQYDDWTTKGRKTWETIGCAAATLPSLDQAPRLFQKNRRVIIMQQEADLMKETHF
jgi:hypothetical protein